MSRRIPAANSIASPAATKKPERPSSTKPPPPPIPSGPPPGLDATSHRIWEYLSEPRHIDEIARELAIPAGELVRTLTLLEMKKVLRKMPGNVFTRRDG